MVFYRLNVMMYLLLQSSIFLIFYERDYLIFLLLHFLRHRARHLLLLRQAETSVRLRRWTKKNLGHYPVHHL